MSSPEPIYYTADEVRALNAAEPRHWPRYECVYGELLLTPSPTPIHYWVARRLFQALTSYTERHAPHAVAMHAPADVSWGREDTTVQPDVLVAPREMVPDSWEANSWIHIRQLRLAAEVLSPSTRRGDRFSKRQLYQREGVPPYWIIDPDTQSAEVWTPEAHCPVIERERLVWRPEGAAEPFVQPLTERFAEP